MQVKYEMNYDPLSVEYILTKIQDDSLVHVDENKFEKQYRSSLKN